MKPLRGLRPEVFVCLFWRHGYYATGLSDCQGFLTDLYNFVKTQFGELFLLANTKFAKDLLKQVIAGSFTRDLTKRIVGSTQIDGDKIQW